MASRRDLYQSYQFLVRRVVSGLVLRETDPAQDPLKRSTGAVFAGVMVAVLSLAVTGVIGVIRPGGNTSWQESGAVLVEEGTGARYVWLEGAGGDFALHPVTDYASAVLLAGTTETVSVSRESLGDAPRGQRLGIVGGPDSLPPADAVSADPWTLCAAPVELSSGETEPRTALLVGGGARGGAELGEAMVLVRDVEDGTLHVVWGGRQFPVPDEQVLLEGLVLRDEPQVQVGTAWLDGLPEGRALAPEPVADRGQPSSAVPGGVVGQVRVVQSPNGDEQYYQVDVDAIVEITQVQSTLLLADPDIQGSVYGGARPEALPLSAAEANATDRVALPEPTSADPPAEQPPVADPSSESTTLCAAFAGAEEPARVSLGAEVDTAAAADTPQRSSEGTVLADAVVVPPGGGALVRSLSSATAGTGPLFLVTDDGRRFAVPDDEVAATLGYADVEALALPESLVARVPQGPALDPVAAAAPA